MPSIGLWITWAFPKMCDNCGVTADWETSPLPELRQRIKCRACNHVYTLDPQLTAHGEQLAKQEFIASLARGHQTFAP